MYVNNPKKFEFVQLTKTLLLKKTPMAREEHDEVPFDLYCPSMHEKLTRGICKLCKRYWPSAAAIIRQQKIAIANRSRMSWKWKARVVDRNVNRNLMKNDQTIKTMENTFDILASPFIEEEQLFVIFVYF